MENKYTKNALLCFVIVVFFATVTPALARIHISGVDTTLNKTALKFKDSRPNRPVFENAFKTDFDAFMFKMTAIRTGLGPDNTILNKPQGVKNLGNVSLDIQKPIDNVKVYPNPVADEINLSYSLKKDGLVVIKILDVLGNEVSTLLNQKLNAGLQTNKFLIDRKLTSGFYFVRIIAGSESVVKRISVL